MDDSVVADTNRTIEPKMQYTGKVIKVSLAGAVIDIGMEKPAVLHISQIVSPDNSPVKRNLLIDNLKFYLYLLYINNKFLDILLLLKSSSNHSKI